MARNKLFEFTSKMTGADRVRQMINTAVQATGVVLGSKEISKKILKMQQDRFGTTGPRAQRDPEGIPWAKLSKNTKRRKNKNPNQKLVDTSKLRNSIVIARDNLKSALRVGTGHAEIAVRHVQNRQISKSGKVNVRYTDDYGARLQEGFTSSWGGEAPPRPFLGVGKGDAREIEKYMTETLNRFFVNFS